MFSCEFVKISENTFFVEHLPKAASDHPRLSFLVVLPLNSTNSTSFFVVVNSEFITQTNNANCAAATRGVL